MFRLFAAFVLLGLSGCAAPMAGRPSAEPVTVGILAFNDFHGNLEPPPLPGSPGETQAPGGAAALAATLDRLRGRYPASLTVSAGDLISASPLVSALFLDEPTIAAMNRTGLDFNAVGNHEFDRGMAELLRMQRGGCERHAARAPCQVEPFAGARFAFLAASTRTEGGDTLFPATGLKRLGPVTIGVIGLTLRQTPTLVSPDGVRGLTFGDEAEAINAQVPGLKAQGADAVVVLIHQGGRVKPGGDPSACADLAGDIVPIIDRLDPRIDVVVSGHTHEAYVCDYRPAGRDAPLLLTSAGSLGRLVTDIALTIDPAAHRVVARRAANVAVNDAPRGDIAAYVARYAEAARTIAERPVGRLSEPADRSRAASPVDQGGTLGNLVADAQLAATASAGAEIALTNPFGLRAPLAPGADGSLTFGAIHAAQPFGNRLVTQTLTGAELRAVLEQTPGEGARQQFLAPSAGFAYRMDRARPPGGRIVAMTFHGAPIDPARSYRVTTNSFLANGGDGFTLLARQRDAVIGIDDLAALEAWLKAAPARAVPREVRVTDVVR